MMTKILLYVTGAFVLAVIALWLLFTVTMSVGHINYMFVKHDLHRVTQQARGLSLGPGESVGIEVRDGKLVPVKYARIRAVRHADGRLFVRFYRGGGHIGSQGYIYSEDPEFWVADADGFPLAESNEYKRLNSNWWSYDSTED
jgi:hypothetical protein